MKRIAMELGLPGNASREDTFPMLEGKLEEQGREPRNIQVQLTEEEGAVRTIELLGAGGAFLQIEVEPEEQDEDGHSEVEGGEEWKPL